MSKNFNAVTSRGSPPSLHAMAAYFLKLGTLGFGGPIVLCEHMRKDLVESKAWITPQEYAEGFALAQLAPGPLAAQLAIYLGWVRGGVFWATLIGLSFILPSFLMVLALAAFYVQFGGLTWIQGAFYGIGAAVIAIIGQSAYKLISKTFKTDVLLWSIGLVSAAFTVWTESENLWIFLAGGVLVCTVKSLANNSPNLSGKKVALAWPIFLYFAKAGAVVFGSGLAIVPFLHSGVVLEHHWLTERQFLDAVAVAMITPGPVVITVAFIGYLVAGAVGGTAAALGVFLPCYLFVIIPAPYYSRIAKNKSIAAFVTGVTTAAIGAIAGAAVILGRRAIVDWFSLAVAALALLCLFRFKWIPEPVLILVAGLAGIAFTAL